MRQFIRELKFHPTRRRLLGEVGLAMFLLVVCCIAEWMVAISQRRSAEVISKIDAVVQRLEKISYAETHRR